MSSEHLSAGDAGEAELMWRYRECGEMGTIEDIPDECPSCNAPRRHLLRQED